MPAPQSQEENYEIFVKKSHFPKTKKNKKFFKNLLTSVLEVV